jgi:coenzyme F420-reducing hydrogenase alpha subunit
MHETEGAGPPAGDDVATTTRYAVRQLTRVEGEGRLDLVVRDGRVDQARLEIFEAPRYFERLVVGRDANEVIDIVARICGICPIAYQMSAVHAFERLYEVDVDPVVRTLRRLFYCGEWIESHGLHVYLLHAPDFLGYPSAIELAADHREIVERGLRLKKLGNRLVAILGGRPIHPVSVRVGGFSRAPRADELAGLGEDLAAAIDDARETVAWTASLAPPPFDREPRLVSLRHPDEYPMNEGRIVSSDGIDVAQWDWPDAFEEHQVPWSNALQARARDGVPYLLGPTARVALAGDRLHPIAREALAATGLDGELRTNVFRSIVARSVELLHAVAEAVDIIAAYRPPDTSCGDWSPRAGVAAWATEAPRGLLFHRYEVDAGGLVRRAQIVPPTSQNQAAIEHDLAAFAPSVLDLPHVEATHRLEQLIRSYDPCISCATHFLDLRVRTE